MEMTILSVEADGTLHNPAVLLAVLLWSVVLASLVARLTYVCCHRPTTPLRVFLRRVWSVRMLLALLLTRQVLDAIRLCAFGAGLGSLGRGITDRSMQFLHGRSSVIERFLRLGIHHGCFLSLVEGRHHVVSSSRDQ